jgi:F-type H+-transporting ATPase subunit epsilon
MAFKCTLVTPETQLFDDSATSVVLPAFDGQIGILTDHAPALMKLGSGELLITTAAKATVRFFVDGGVAQMKDNVLTILTDQAIDPAKIDVEAAKKELAELSAFTTMTDAQAKTHDRRMKRATAMLRLAGAA